MAKKKPVETSPQMVRFKRTVKLKTALDEALRDWEFDGENTDREMDISDAFERWCADMGDLPEEKS